MYIHVGTACRLKGHNPGLKGFRCVQFHNVQWQQIPISHCSWEKLHLSGVNTTEFQLKCPVVCISRASTRWYQSVFFGDGYQLSINFVHHHQSCIFSPGCQRSPRTRTPLKTTINKCYGDKYTTTDHHVCQCMFILRCYYHQQHSPPFFFISSLKQ